MSDDFFSYSSRDAVTVERNGVEVVMKPMNPAQFALYDTARGNMAKSAIFADKKLEYINPDYSGKFASVSRELVLACVESIGGVELTADMYDGMRYEAQVWLVDQLEGISTLQGADKVGL